MTSDAAAVEPNARAVALAGAVSLAVAMGIGRFAFTPLLPMMLHDGVIGLPMASALASANYLGYLAGALWCTLRPWWRSRWHVPKAAAATRAVPPAPAMPDDGPRLLRAGLAATVLLTLGMALPWPVLWPLLRFAAGVASALVFVHTSGWCLAQLARRSASGLGGVMYAGPGAGIVASGLFASAMVQWQWRAAAGWLIFGLLAALCTALVWRRFGPPSHSAAPAAAPAPTMGAGAAARASMAPGAGPHGRVEIGLLALAYGLAGFGYIITATFLPVIARTALPGSPWIDLFWPLFGAGVVIGALGSTRLHISGDLRGLLVAGYALQAGGIAVSLWSPSLAGFALGSLMLGLPFTAITFFAMQEVRRVRPNQVPAFMGLLTALYGIGQILGPPLVALLLRHTESRGAGFTLSLQVAMAALLLGAALFGALMRRYPMHPSD